MHPTRIHSAPSSEMPLMSRLLLKAIAGLAWSRPMPAPEGSEVAGVRVSAPQVEPARQAA